MTRSIKPNTRYDEHESYPSAVADQLSRRGFLQVTLAGSAATAAAVLVPGEATGRRKRKRVRLYLRRRYHFRGGNYRLDRLDILTHSTALVTFVQDTKQRAALEKAVVKVLDKFTCDVARKGRKLAKLEAALSRAVAAHYRKKTRRRVRRPSVMVLIGLPRSHCRGKCRPVVPYCKPPK